FTIIGVYSAFLIPREEEPQIEVPMADIFVGYPGAGPKEVESRIAKPLEKILSNIQGVEHVYTTSMQGQGMATVQCDVGKNTARSQVGPYDDVDKHVEPMPKLVKPASEKGQSIEAVALLTRDIGGEMHAAFDLRAIGEDQ